MVGMLLFCFPLSESDEFIVSVLGCLLVRETLCERGDESSNAEESQLDFMSREKQILIPINKQPNTQASPSVLFSYTDT